MNKILEVRRSIRKYESTKVSYNLVEQLIKSILRSPSSKNVKPWEFLLVDDATIIDRLSECKKFGSAFLSEAPQCLVVLADESKTDVWIEDASVATTIAHLTATDLGLGSCWIQIRNRFTKHGSSSEDYIREIFDLPSNIRVEAILSFGYPLENKNGINEKGLDFSKVKYNDYNNKFFK